ncbi:CHAD domain-containing protein [Streptacidiphilus sp. MAP12-33]|uniref:CYTH and CHAD domain-containing protein n=1 Tax=Streptacidiphilus sp. MAP12-33 TaxID=3156266 RepID=UPI0035163201
MARKTTVGKPPARRSDPPAAEGHLERERKYEGEATASLPSLVPVEVTAVTAGTEQLRAVYYDTPDLRLLAHRITLRRRTGGHDAGWHLKLPAADGARLELQLPLGSPEPDAAATATPTDVPTHVPADFLARVRAYSRAAELAPIARLATERRRTLLTDGADRVLAELAEDTVTAHALDPSGAVRHEQRWQEVEAELVDGEGTLLDAVEERLLAAGLHRSASASKLARALGPAPAVTAVSAAPGDEPGDEPDDVPGREAAGEAGDKAGGEPWSEPAPGSVGALLTALLRQQVGQLLAQDAEVRRDRPDAVHQMRICARRLRSTLRVHERLLRPDAAGGLTSLAALEEELRWLGHTLGTARDREVLGERLLRDLDALDRAERPGPMRRRLKAWSRQGYRTAWRLTIRELEGARYFALLDALERLAARPPLRRRAGRPAAAEVHRLLSRERRRACRRVAQALALPHGTERDEAMHAARRAAKRARYAGEGAARPLFAAAMKGLQTVLGERQDALMAAQALPELAASAHRAGEPGFGYGVLYVRQRDAVAAAEAEVPGAQAVAGAVRVK